MCFHWRSYQKCGLTYSDSTKLTNALHDSLDSSYGYTKIPSRQNNKCGSKGSKFIFDPLSLVFTLSIFQGTRGHSNIVNML